MLNSRKQIDICSLGLTMREMRRLLLMGVFFAFGGLLFLEAQEENPASLVNASLISEVKEAEPGATVWMVLRFEVAPHWHLGWAVAGDAGLPTEVKWTSPKGVTMGELLFPVPSRFEYEGFVSYVHEGILHVLAPVSISSDWEKGKAIEIAAEASWSVCNETNCFPVDRKFSLSLSTGEKTIYDDSQKLIFDKARQSLPTPLPDFVQGSAYLGEKEIVFRLSGQELAQDDLGKVFFFSRDGVVAPAKPQKFSLEEGAFVLRMARDEFSDVPERFRDRLRLFAAARVLVEFG